MSEKNSGIANIHQNKKTVNRKNDVNKENAWLEKMDFLDKDFIKFFRGFLDDNLNKLLGELKLEYSLNEVDIKGVKTAWIETINSSSNNKGVIIFLHGGCYMYGNVKNYCTIPVQISNATGLKVLSVNYGLAPEKPFPKGLEDVLKVYNYLLEEGYEANSIAITGDSAGGGLALATVLKLRDLRIDLPAALGLFSPWVDLTLKGDTIKMLKEYDPVLSKKQLKGAAKIYAGKEDMNNPLISPVFGDYKDFPPMMILTGGREILLSDSMNLARKAALKKNTVSLLIWDNLYHVFAADSNLPASKEAMEALGGFLLENMRLN